MNNFKRFTNLEISQIPETARLVVVLGPNGSGKSSLFDALVHWNRSNAGYGIDHDEKYFRKDTDIEYSSLQSVRVDIYNNEPVVKGSLYMRTAYRNDPDFNIGQINRMNSPIESIRISKSINNDQVVSENYQRLLYDTVSEIYDEQNDSKSVKFLREQLIGKIAASMRNVFEDLELKNLADPLSDGSFTFAKGSVKSYHYKNLSGGEKAAFDLLLDMHIKKKYYTNTIWCIDELETHLHTRVQGRLLKEMFDLITETSQLWINTHSLGVMRTAQILSLQFPGSVSVIDFEGINPDIPQQISPSNINRVAWEKMLSIAMDDLSPRVIPSTIVICEGSLTGTKRKNFDAEIYNRIFHRYFEVTFISGGSSNQLLPVGNGVRGILSDLAVGARVLCLCDRDDRSDHEVTDFERLGNIVLKERNLESYLFAEDVLCDLAITRSQTEKLNDVKAIRASALAASSARGNRPDDLKSASGEIFTQVVKLLGLQRAGNNVDAFMRDTLAPLIVEGTATYTALKSTIIDKIT